MDGRWRMGMVAVIGSLMLLGGCSKYARSLDMVRADGNAAYAAGKYTVALTDYQEYMERKPGSTEVRYRLGETLMQLHRATEAESHFRAVYDVNPNNVKHAKGLASAMIAGGRGGDGLDFFRAYLDQRPTSEGYFALADLARQAGVPDDAERALLIAAKLDGTTSPEPHRHLGRFYEEMRKDELAVQRWRAVLFFDVMDTEARDHLRALGQVPGPSAALDPSTLD